MEKPMPDELYQLAALETARAMVIDNMQELFFARDFEADYVSGDTITFMKGYRMALEDIYHRMYGKPLELPEVGATHEQDVEGVPF